MKTFLKGWTEHTHTFSPGIWQYIRSLKPLLVILTDPSALPQKVEPGEKRPRGRPRKWVWSNRWQLETRSKCPKPPRCLLQLYSPWRRLGFHGWFICGPPFSTAPKKSCSRSSWRAGEERKILWCLLVFKDWFCCVHVAAQQLWQVFSVYSSLCNLKKRS